MKETDFTMESTYSDDLNALFHMLEEEKERKRGEFPLYSSISNTERLIAFKCEMTTPDMTQLLAYRTG